MALMDGGDELIHSISRHTSDQKKHEKRAPVGKGLLGSIHVSGFNVYDAMKQAKSNKRGAALFNDK